MKRIAKVLLATVALSSLFTPIAQSQLWGGRSKNVPASAPSPAASMTLWQARKTIIQQFPRVLQHREWKAGLSFSECRDVNITAVRIHTFNVEYDYTASWYDRGGAACNDLDRCGKAATTNALNLQQLAAPVGVVGPGWRPASYARNECRNMGHNCATWGWSWKPCEGYCLVADSEYLSSDLMWATPQEAQAAADAINLLRAEARGERSSQLDPIWSGFPEKAAAWRALPSKPPIPEAARQHRLLAESAISEKDLDSAISEYEEGLALYPVWPEGHFNAALLSAELGYFAMAIRHMQAYLDLVPDAADAAAARDQVVIWQSKLR